MLSIIGAIVVATLFLSCIFMFAVSVAKLFK